MEKLILDWEKYRKKAIECAREGCVLLENKNVLPFDKGIRLSVFGRIATHYYKSGTGSGGMVNVHNVVGILDALKEREDVKLNKILMDRYEEWEKTHPFDEGAGWGQQPWSQEEMPLKEQWVEEASECSDAALIIIGRTAGEDKDASDEKGSYRLTDAEEDMLCKVRKYFDKVVVLLNVGGIIDMSFMDRHHPDAVMYVWHGGMYGGYGVADVVMGDYSPSGRLADSIAYDIADYPSHKYFGNNDKNYYTEDIYVGYRYFETFAREKVRYPFGYGLSYTDFKIECVDCSFDGKKVSINVKVTNIGEFAGKEVVQMYVNAPDGRLGTPDRVLTAFEKTSTLRPGESEEICLECGSDRFMSYDDKISAFVLQEGCYRVYVGTDVRSAGEYFSFTMEEEVTCRLKQALAPVENFKRFVKDKEGKIVFEDVVLLKESEQLRCERNRPEDVKCTGEKGILLQDVLQGSHTMDEFVAQLDNDDLASIVRGEGMGSSRVTPGTAAAFGGVTKKLQRLGVPAVCCDDGPSGMRLDSGAKAFSIPIGTLIASTFNRQLTTELFEYLGMEMAHNNVECLLGPGMNIHRHPLNGRNFEYFSEDPLVTGMIACAELKGLQKNNVTGTLKHFCANNQEKNRHGAEAVVSERALREIYLKGFEIAIKEGKATTIMTTYGPVNGLWTAGSYDLTTTILREQWGFKGIAMTDWWAVISERGKKPTLTNFAAMVKAQNDVYMVTPDSEHNTHGDNIAEALKDNRLTRAELVRCAKNILYTVMHTRAMDRLLGLAKEIEIINRPVSEDDIDATNVEYMKLKECQVLDLTVKESKKGSSYVYAYEVDTLGEYIFTLTGSSTLGRLAQIPVTILFSEIPEATFTFNGSEGKDVKLEKTLIMPHRFTIVKVYVAEEGVNLKSLEIKKSDKPAIALNDWINSTRGN